MQSKEKVEHLYTLKELEDMIEGSVITRGVGKYGKTTGYDTEGNVVIISSHKRIVLHHMLTNQGK